MSEFKKPFMKSKDALWQQLVAELEGEFRFPPLESQKSNVEAQYDNWKLNLSIGNDPLDPDNPGPSLYINPTGLGGMGL